jgi:pimeloyl-ACP methyl ester carboxylesterase
MAGLRLARLGCLVLVGPAVSAPASEAGPPGPKDQTVRLTLSGALRPIEICRERHRAAVVRQEVRPTAAIRLVDRSGLRWGGRRTAIVVDRCDDGAWRRMSAKGFGRSGEPYRRVRRYRRPLVLDIGDYRVHARVAGDRHRLPARSQYAYVRVGVGEIVDVPVSFRVRNVNHSRAACSPGGGEHTLRGHLVAPRAALARAAPRAVTLYLHGGVVGEPTWHFEAVPGYDYAEEQARGGHVSVVVDQLGYGRSDIPNGAELCAGAHADMAHQMIGALRGGDYAIGGRDAVNFQRVALGGFSFGMLIAQVEAYSFRDIDALVVGGWTDQGPSSEVFVTESANAGAVCAQGGEPKRPGAASAYAYVFRREGQPPALIFFNADPRVMEAVRHLHEREPCGFVSQATIQAVAANNAFLGTVDVPVLLVFGDQDAVWPRPAPDLQRERYSGSPDVTLRYVEHTGHTMMLERTAPKFRAMVSDWLRRRGF